MAFLEIKNVSIAGISAAVPKRIISNLDNPNISTDYTPEQFVESTGIKERRIDDLSISELFQPAVEKLIADLKWDKSEIDALIVVTQMGDYILPATACVLQGKLGLSNECYALDINLGCSGWVYGLSTAAALLSNGNLKKAILCTGDAKRRAIYDDALFGFAGTATALQYMEGCESLKFHFGTDGERFDALIIPDGGSKNPITERSLVPHEFEGKMLLPLQSHMKGMDVFSFGFSTAPKSIKKLSARTGFDYLDADFVILHQANMKMNNLIAKKLKLPDDKVPSCLNEFGNTSSASIPLTIVTRLNNVDFTKTRHLICCAFGVGLSWGSVIVTTNNGFIVSRLVEV